MLGLKPRSQGWQVVSSATKTLLHAAGVWEAHAPRSVVLDGGHPEVSAGIILRLEGSMSDMGIYRQPASNRGRMAFLGVFPNTELVYI